ncbi:hypothetical protein, partial [Sphingomonas sp. 10B4]|uniref:hypothetical protein n=1 Tax=Sphingomonas sp. 10B4 TaxID=3048575 RepID=UPI002B230CD5
MSAMWPQRAPSRVEHKPKKFHRKFVFFDSMVQNHVKLRPELQQFYRDTILIVYEYPFNERIRTLLRLEDLYEKFIFFLH